MVAFGLAGRGARSGQRTTADLPVLAPVAVRRTQPAAGRPLIDGGRASPPVPQQKSHKNRPRIFVMIWIRGNPRESVAHLLGIACTSGALAPTFHLTLL